MPEEGQMKRQDRAMATSLESIMTRHATKKEELDERTLNQLHAAGHINIRSVAEAYDRLEAQRELPGFTQSQLDMVMYQRRSRTKKGLVA